jgi:hypothetical protein
MEKQADWEKIMQNCNIDTLSIEQQNFFNFDWVEKLFIQRR